MYVKYLILMILPFCLQAEIGILVKVVDGDTLYFKSKNKKIKCRIQHIDTPESSENKKLKRDISKCNVSAKDMKASGKSATRYAKRLLTMNKEYEYTINSKDHYGRSICIVNLKNTTFNEQMILGGYAVPYRSYMNSRELKHYNSLLSKAKSSKVGLWKDRKNIIECLDKARK